VPDETDVEVVKATKCPNCGFNYLTPRCPRCAHDESNNAPIRKGLHISRDGMCLFPGQYFKVTDDKVEDQCNHPKDCNHCDIPNCRRSYNYRFRILYFDAKHHESSK